MSADDLYIHYSEQDGSFWESLKPDYGNSKYKLLSDDPMSFEVSGVFCRAMEEKYPKIGSFENSKHKPPYPKLRTIQREFNQFFFWHKRLSKAK